MLSSLCSRCSPDRGLRGARRTTMVRSLAAVLALAAGAPLLALPASAANDAYRPPNGDYGSLGTMYEREGAPSGGGYAGNPSSAGPYSQAQSGNGSYGATTGAGDVYYPPRAGGGAPANDSYRPPSSGGQYGADYPPPSGGRDYASPAPAPGPGYGEPYQPPRQYERGPDDRDYGNSAPPRERTYDDGPRRPSTYSKNEIVDTGHHFFGSVSQGLASIIEYAFQEAGRPNGYVLGEDAGGAFVAGLRYGEGTLHTKDAGNHKVFWQGPSLGYDFGAEGSKTMVLVYNLRDVSEIYNRFGGVQGSAYVIGGVSIQFQKYGDVVLAPIRSGLGLRLGANVGYLKYTRSPTWNPF